MVLPVVLALLLFLIFIVLSRIKFHVEYHRNQQDDRLFINISILKGLISFKTELTGADFEEKFNRMSVDLETELKGEVAEFDTGLDERIKLPLNYRTVKVIINVIKNLMEVWSAYKKVTYKIIGFVRINEFQWETQFGVGDAAVTGIISGLVWGVKGLVMQIMQRLTFVSFYRVNVLPDFTGNTLNVNLRCIFDIRIGHIIIAGINLLIIRIKRGSNK